MHEKFAELRQLSGIPHGRGHLLNINSDGMEEQRNDDELETNVSKEHSQLRSQKEGSEFEQVNEFRVFNNPHGHVVLFYRNYVLWFVATFPQLFFLQSFSLSFKHGLFSLYHYER